MTDFIKEDLEFYLPEIFKGLSKSYILECIPTKGEQTNLNHSSIRKFKYVPYPHERNK